MLTNLLEGASLMLCKQEVQKSRLTDVAHCLSRAPSLAAGPPKALLAPQSPSLRMFIATQLSPLPTPILQPYMLLLVVGEGMGEGFFVSEY